MLKMAKKLINDLKIGKYNTKLFLIFFGHKRLMILFDSEDF